MKPLSPDAWRRTAAATEPSADQVERLRRRIAWPTTLLRGAERDAPAVVPVRRRVRPAVWGTLVALPIAAALLLSLRPTPPQPLNIALADHMTLTTEVDVVATGTGHAAGTDRAPRLTWEAGDLDVELTPDQGVDLRVTTPDAEVQVVGTGFRVRRDALGTSVSVRHGVVRVRCVAGGESELRTGAETTCWPARAAGLLGRARAQRTAGADADTILATLTAGLAAARPGDPVGDELGALRIETLALAGRVAEARAAADAWLASGATTRRDQVEAIRASLPEEN